MSPVVMAILVLSLYAVFYRFYARGVLSRRVFALAAWVVVVGALAVWGIRREPASEAA